MSKIIFIISLLFIFVFIFSFYLFSENNNPTDNHRVTQKITTLSEVARLLYPLSVKYEIEFYISESIKGDYAGHWADWEVLNEGDADELNRYVKIFIEEWSKYPADWVKNSNLKGIAFVKGLQVIGQHRAAMPDAYAEILYYDIGYGYAGEIYERSTIHHEYYHMIEENYFGSMYYKDPIWTSFNAPDFQYKQGGYQAYEDGSFINLEHPTGFVDNYSTYGLEEDKAQIYAYLMTTTLFNKLIEWIKNDKILANKVNYMMNFMNKYSSKINKDYFYMIHLVDTENSGETDLVIEDTIDTDEPIDSEADEETDLVIEDTIDTTDETSEVITKGFDRLLTSITDKNLKKKLEKFYKKGIEFPLDIKNTTPEMLIEIAKKYLGVPHKFGGSSKSGLDCSGLIMVSFARLGISLPHSAQEQARYGKVIPFRDELIKGDLVFFINTYKTNNLITHVGIYLGNNNFIHTSSSKGVIISSMNNIYWEPRFIFGTRVF